MKFLQLHANQDFKLKFVWFITWDGVSRKTSIWNLTWSSNIRHNRLTLVVHYKRRALVLETVDLNQERLEQNFSWLLRPFIFETHNHVTHPQNIYTTYFNMTGKCLKPGFQLRYYQLTNVVMQGLNHIYLGKTLDNDENSCWKQQRW